MLCCHLQHNPSLFPRIYVASTPRTHLIRLFRYAPHLISRTLELILNYILALTFRAFWHRRLQLAQFVSSNAALNVSRYIRLMMLAITDMLLTIPLGAFSIYLGTHGVELSPWISWDDTHFNFSRVQLVPALIWRSDATFQSSVELTRWLYVASAFIFFALFGFAGEAQKHYKLLFWACVKPFGFKPSTAMKSQISSLPRFVNLEQFLPMSELTILLISVGESLSTRRTLLFHLHMYQRLPCLYHQNPRVLALRPPVMPPYTLTSTSKNLQDSLLPPPTLFHQNIATHPRHVSHSQTLRPTSLSQSPIPSGLIVLPSDYTPFALPYECCIMYHKIRHFFVYRKGRLPRWYVEVCVVFFFFLPANFNFL